MRRRIELRCDFLLEHRDSFCGLLDAEYDILEVLQADTNGLHLVVGDVVEIWSGRSDQVRDETEYWLSRHDIDPALLTRMRAAGDHTPDVDRVRHLFQAIYPH